MVEKTASRTKSRTKKARQKMTPKVKDITDSLIPAEEQTGMSDEPAEYVESLISPEERLNMISEAAYYRAEQRGFGHGGHEQDWVEAEMGVDKMLSDAAKKANF